MTLPDSWEACKTLFRVSPNFEAEIVWAKSGEGEGFYRAWGVITWYANDLEKSFKLRRCVDIFKVLHCLAIDMVEISVEPPKSLVYVGAYRDKWFLDLKWQGGRQDSAFRERRIPIATAKVCGTEMNDHSQ